ncbi:MAG TPA: START domain-containing protein [Chitinophagaceae bacterium]|nr:START domain-containing protein [Chitinophagaceae bacterium]
MIGRRSILIFTALMLVHIAAAQKTWKLISEKDGIYVYTQNLEDSKFKAVRAVCTVDCGVAKLAYVLMDVSNTRDWVYATKVCTLLKKMSPTDIYYYPEVELPWPVSNRDFIIRITLTQDQKTKVARIVAENHPQYVPEKKNVIRIPKSAGNWILTPLGDGRTKVEYVIHVDPGGSVPAWLVNMLADVGPYSSFTKLKKEVLKEKYNGVKLDGIID